MTDSLLQEIACPNCRNPLQLEPHAFYVICAACGSRFVLRGHICPQCGTYYEDEVSYCRRCGLSLVRRCPKCDTPNWVGDPYCVQCGSPLDILETLAQRQRTGTADRLYQQMDEAREIKEREEAASAERMARMRAQDEIRQAEALRRLREQQEQERKVMTIVAIALGVFLLLVIVYLIFF